MRLPDIIYNGDVSKFVQDADGSDSIMLFKDTEYFLDSVPYSRFIKDVERMVRTSKDYSTFISYVKRELGLNFCQVSSQIFDDGSPGAPSIELHHGPLFTLYDICEVLLNYFMMSHKKITTFRVADKVLDEHFDLCVQFVMLSKTNHEAVHNRDIFINLNQAFGDIDRFIKKYTAYLTNEQKYKIWNFVDLCESTTFGKSFDRGFLDIDYVKRKCKVKV